MHFPPQSHFRDLQTDGIFRSQVYLIPFWAIANVTDTNQWANAQFRKRDSSRNSTRIVDHWSHQS